MQISFHLYSCGVEWLIVCANWHLLPVHHIEVHVKYFLFSNLSLEKWNSELMTESQKSTVRPFMYKPLFTLYNVAQALLLSKTLH